ncbi:MAG: dioxygenase [Paracoccaceae bacterium]|nr:dioxygenase [Paracoccaceae bacterium]
MDGRGASTLEERPAVAFASRVAGAPDRRLAMALSGLVEHMENLVTTLDLTRDDLRAILAFLTDVGEACSEQRQEWVLLADTLGLSSIVENQVSRRPAGATPNTLPGPFYRADAPARADGDSISFDGRGVPLHFAAEVTDLDGDPVAGARLEVWQANGDGLYENQDPDRQPEFNLRGVFRTDGTGRVSIRSVRPAGYAVPADGPVGQLARRLGLGLRRPAHMHFRITAAGFQTLTTHVFDAADPDIGRDPLFAVHPALLATFVPNGDGVRAAYRFVLARARRRDRT